MVSILLFFFLKKASVSIIFQIICLTIISCFIICSHAPRSNIGDRRGSQKAKGRSLITLEIRRRTGISQTIIVPIGIGTGSDVPFLAFFFLKTHASWHVPTLCRGAKSRDRKKHPNWYWFYVDVAPFHPRTVTRQSSFVSLPFLFTSILINAVYDCKVCVD